MKQSKATLASRPVYGKRFLAELSERCRRLGVTREGIAAEASKTSARGAVKPPTVSNVFARRRKSANVVEAALRLCSAAEEARKAS